MQVVYVKLAISGKEIEHRGCSATVHETGALIIMEDQLREEYIVQLMNAIYAPGIWATVDVEFVEE